MRITRLFYPALFIAAQFVFQACVSTSNFYSAKTLEPKKFAVTIGADDIILKSANEDITISKDVPFTPSLGVSYGLPYRLETGVRWFIPNLLEGTVRYQLNPPAFDALDGSVNLTYGYLFNGYSYLKYGLTFSKDISGFEPFVHLAKYQYISATNGDFSDSYLSGEMEDFVNGNNSLGFGVGIPLKGARIFPEAAYQFYNNDIKNGLWHFGIGIRINTSW